MAFEIEKDWQTEAGFRAVVGIVVREGGRRSHRCGYVAIPKWHPLHGVGYSQQADCLTQSMADQARIGKKSPILAITAACGSDNEGETVRRSPDVVFDVHGGLTYADGDQYPAPHDGLWWFGFDAAHCDDGYIDQSLQYEWRNTGIVRDLDYMTAECESLARQIAEICAAPGCDYPRRPMIAADIQTQGE